MHRYENDNYLKIDTRKDEVSQAGGAKGTYCDSFFICVFHGLTDLLSCSRRHVQHVQILCTHRECRECPDGESQEGTATSWNPESCPNDDITGMYASPCPCANIPEDVDIPEDFDIPPSWDEPPTPTCKPGDCVDVEF